MNKIIDISSPRIYIIHENDTWVEPLREAFAQIGTPFQEWFIDEGLVDIQDEPPVGVFYNRMSASSHTRDHRYAVELSESLIAWLESHDRRVVNNRRAVQLEVRKVEQYIELKKHGILIPESIAAVGKKQIVDAARRLGKSEFILKPNRGGKGKGVQLFRSIESLEAFLETEEEVSLDGVAIIQEYVKPASGSIVRLEFIGGRFYYAVRVDASGGFELCPADSCQVGDAFCPAPGEKASSKFELLPGFDIPEIKACEAFLRSNGMEVAAMEFAENENGERYFYDVNINTNYNAAAELEAGAEKRGMLKIAQFLTAELAAISKSKDGRVAI
jgi:hypothetical protein